VSWFLAFAGFAALIILHELGHFTAAKAVGMRVERFSLFFGRTKLRWQRGDTEYGVGWLPLGGFVKITGMNPAEEIPPEVAHRAYYRQPVWKRLVVIAAGPAVNIFLAFVTSAGMFGAMSVYGMVTKRDLTSWGSFFFMGLIGIIICSVVNIFLHSTALGYAISFIGVFVFLGLTAYDTQKLKAYATAPELRENLAVYGALALYLDFINLFLMLLRLFGGGNRR